MKKNLSVLGVALIVTFSFISCKTENKFIILKDEPSKIISDNDIKKLAQTHNEYLEKMVANYDYSTKDAFLAVKESFLKSDLALLNESDKQNIFKKIENQSISMNNLKGGSIVSVVTLETLINEININDSENHDVLIQYLQSATDKATKGLISRTALSSFLDSLSNNAIISLNEKELIIFKTYTETLKASVYFWFPIELGGSGIGYAHLQKLAGNKKSFLPWYGAALISDASSMGIGMIGVAITGIVAGPIGWAALAFCAGDSAANSGIAGAIQAYFNKN
jgi:hypothetical protein